MRRMMQIFVGIALAGISGAAVALKTRRGRRLDTANHAPQPVQEDVSPNNDQRSPQKPPLSPGWFAASHFSLLVLLTAMAVGGLFVRGIRRYPPEATWHINDGDATRGRAALITHGCGGCHVIPEISDFNGRVGPPLGDFGQRMYIGGQLANTPENLISWLQNPQRHAPGTAMPNLNITEPVARDMAAYLYHQP